MSLSHANGSYLRTNTNKGNDDQIESDIISDEMSETSSDESQDDIEIAEQNSINFEENYNDFDDTTEFFEHTNHFLPEDRADLCKLHPHTDCTRYDAFLMIFVYSKRHGLTWEATEDLARLINRIIGEEKIPPSKKAFKQKFRPMNCTPVKHFLCDACDLYLGTLSEIENSQSRYCPNCSAQIQLDTKYKKNHFITIPFRNHMKQILEQNSDKLSLNSCRENTDICDVHDGLCFRNMRNKAGNSLCITLTFSTDGAAIFKSTKNKSVWPIQFIINELDLNERFKRENVFCAAISFGKTPNMQVYLKPFFEEIMQINNEGGLSFRSKTGEIIEVMIYPMILTCDILAKQYVLNKGSFHGYKGCSYCLHDGMLVDRRVRYCNKINVQNRTNEGTRADMLQAQMSGEKCNGYNGVSALIAFEHFDIVWQAAIDKMHNIDMGVIKKLFELFLDDNNRTKE